MKITIAIPVFNGEKTIAETLNSVLNQKASCEFDLLIVDNCSTDATYEILSRFEKENSNLRIARNSRNIGYDRNFDKAIRMSTGDYVWLVGDDDILVPGAIATVSQMLEGNCQVGVIFVNYSMVDRKSGRVTIERDVQGVKTTVFKPGSAALQTLHEYPNFLSGLIFRKESWDHAFAARYFDTLYCQYAMYLKITIENESMFIDLPLVQNKCRPDNFEHKPEFYRDYFFNLHKLINVIERVCAYYKVEKSAVQKSISSVLGRRFYRYLRVDKRFGSGFTLEKFRIFLGFVYYRKSLLFYLPLLFIPNILIRSLRRQIK